MDNELDITNDVVAPVKTADIVISTGATIKVRNVTHNEMATVWRKSKDDPFEANKWVVMIAATCKDKHINETQAGNMSSRDVTDIANAIMELSGYSTGALERIKKQMSTTPATSTGS